MGKLVRAVLRGLDRSNPVWLPDALGNWRPYRDNFQRVVISPHGEE